MIKPPFFVQSVFGLLGGIGSHPEDVAHMKRTADRLFGDKFRWSVLGAGAAQLRVAAQAGILERQAQELKDAYAPYCTLQVSDTEDGWILMTAQKPASAA